MSAPHQEFYVTLRVVSDPQMKKKLTEAAVRAILNKSLNVDKMDERIDGIYFGDVIEVPAIKRTYSRSKKKS